MSRAERHCAQCKQHIGKNNVSGLCRECYKRFSGQHMRKRRAGTCQLCGAYCYHKAAICSRCNTQNLKHPGAHKRGGLDKFGVAPKLENGVPVYRLPRTASFEEYPIIGHLPCPIFPPEQHIITRSGRKQRHK